MRVVPERAAWTQLATVFGGFLVGPYLGLKTALFLTPDSDLVQTVSVFAFALVFVGGVLLWMGIGVLTVVASALIKLVRGRMPGPTSLEAKNRIVPSGYRSFVVLGVLLGGVVGVLAGLATDLSVWMGGGVWSLVGFGYGYALRTAAHYGYLPFPEPE